MAVRCPFAQWRPLETAQREPAMRSHDVVCLHTMAGYLLSTDGLFRSGGWDGTESHFGIGGKWGPDLGGNLDGALYQWQDLLHQADANLEGNPRVISIETADNAVPPIQPWTPRQVETIVRLVDWLCSREAHAACPPSWLCHQVGIPRVLLTDSCPGRRGIAYHRLGVPASSPNRPDGPWLQPGCEKWSEARGKVCPSDARIAQIKTVIVPRVAARHLEDDMTPAECKKAVQEVLDSNARRLSGLTSFVGWMTHVRNDAKGARLNTTDLDQVDTAELAALVVAELSPEAIAAAIPADIADKVVDEIHRRTAPAAG